MGEGLRQSLAPARSSRRPCVVQWGGLWVYIGGGRKEASVRGLTWCARAHLGVSEHGVQNAVGSSVAVSEAVGWVEKAPDLPKEP